MSKQLCMHCYISGKVQGLWFRASTKEAAERLGIQGWARNLTDGRVEVWACGEESKLELLFNWLQQGPRHAQVQNCTLDGISYERSAITKWLMAHRITPTRVPMGADQRIEDVLVFNKSLATAIGYAKGRKFLHYAELLCLLIRAETFFRPRIFS